jgi:hypothetical protein
MAMTELPFHSGVYLARHRRRFAGETSRFTAGAGQPQREQPIDFCVICQDERQYLNPTGQQWTAQEPLAAILKACENTDKGVGRAMDDSAGSGEIRDVTTRAGTSDHSFRPDIGRDGAGNARPRL